jgi:PPOX class probable F420-dependent enzyme
MSVTLPDLARRLIEAPENATIATINPDGQPQLSVVWVKRDGDDVLISTIKSRRKYLNLARDPRATVLVFASADPDTYVEVRGTVTMTEEGGPELIQELGLKYDGVPFTADEGTDRVRVVVRLTPTKVITRT